MCKKDVVPADGFCPLERQTSTKIFFCSFRKLGKKRRKEFEFLRRLDSRTLDGLLFFSSILERITIYYNL